MIKREAFKTSVETTVGVERTLRPRLGDRLLVTGDSAFAAARRVWNAAVTRQPAVIARCRDTAEVALAMSAARDNGMPLSVRAGGHDWAGRALRDGGLVVDLTGMRGVTVDPARRTAWSRAARPRPTCSAPRPRTTWSPRPVSSAASEWPGSPRSVGTGR